MKINVFAFVSHSPPANQGKHLARDFLLLCPSLSRSFVWQWREEHPSTQTSLLLSKKRRGHGLRLNTQYGSFSCASLLLVCNLFVSPPAPSQVCVWPTCALTMPSYADSIQFAIGTPLFSQKLKVKQAFTVCSHLALWVFNSFCGLGSVCIGIQFYCGNHPLYCWSYLWFLSATHCWCHFGQVH